MLLTFVITNFSHNIIFQLYVIVQYVLQHYQVSTVMSKIGGPADKPVNNI
jgi:hypothetical protein